MSAPRVRIELFGGLRVLLAKGAPVELSRQQTGALLGYLALNLEKCHNREELIAIFWPDDDAEDGRRKLRQSVYSIRCQFERGSTNSLFVSTRDTIRLNPNEVYTDLVDFEASIRQSSLCDDPSERLNHLVQARSLYRGELLAGYYQDEILSHRSQLAARYRSILQETVRAFESLGDLNGAIESSSDVVAQDPSSEEACADLMRLYAAAGRPSEVLRQLKELERAMDAELEAKPSSAMYALADRLRAEAEIGVAPASLEDHVFPEGITHNLAVDPVEPARPPIVRTVTRRAFFARTAALGVLALPALGWLAMPPRARPRYTVIDLGTFGGDVGYPYRINNAGLIIGRAHSASTDALEACVWTGTAGIAHLPHVGKISNCASGVTDSGQVIGISTDANSVAHGVLWDARGVHDLGADKNPTGISSLGSIIGHKIYPGQQLHGCIWSKAFGARLLQALGGLVDPIDVNRYDWVVGRAVDTRGHLRAFRWDRYAGTRDLGTLGGDNAEAGGINDRGVIVGKAQTTGGHMHAFIFDGERGMRDIGLPGVISTSCRLNNNGTVVGHSIIDSEDRAFIWTESAGLVDLNSQLGASGSGWVLNEALDINDSGWIVGCGTRDGHSRPFLLLPSGAVPAGAAIGQYRKREVRTLDTRQPHLNFPRRLTLN